MESKLLSVADAAAFLGVHRTRINQLINDGQLPATRIGRAYVINQADLELVVDRPSPGRPAKQPDDSEQATTSKAAKPKRKTTKKAEAKKARKKGSGQ